MNENVPFYKKYPVWQVIFIFFWLPLGAIISVIAASLCIKLVTLLAMFVIQFFLYDAMNLYVLSGRLDLLMDSFVIFVSVFYDLLILIVGIEIINYIINKKIFEGDYGDMLDNAKNQILFNKTNNDN